MPDSQVPLGPIEQLTASLVGIHMGENTIRPPVRELAVESVNPERWTEPAPSVGPALVRPGEGVDQNQCHIHDFVSSRADDDPQLQPVGEFNGS